MLDFDKSLIKNDINTLKKYIKKYDNTEGDPAGVEPLGGDLFAWLFDNMDYDNHNLILDYLDPWYYDSREAIVILENKIMEMQESGDTKSHDYASACSAYNDIKDNTIVEHSVVDNFATPLAINGNEMLEFLDTLKDNL